MTTRQRSIPEITTRLDSFFACVWKCINDCVILCTSVCFWTHAQISVFGGRMCLDVCIVSAFGRMQQSMCLDVCSSVCVWMYATVSMFERMQKCMCLDVCSTVCILAYSAVFVCWCMHCVWTYTVVSVYGRMLCVCGWTYKIVSAFGCVQQCPCLDEWWCVVGIWNSVCFWV